MLQRTIWRPYTIVTPYVVRAVVATLLHNITKSGGVMSELHAVTVQGGDSPLNLLRDMRDIMTGNDHAELKLQRLVHLIAKRTNSDVCSIYFSRSSDVLELFATYGLNPDAIHKTRLSVGEGLVGEIAATAKILNLADAQNHPKFAFRPETGEEAFHSFLGVPIIAQHNVIGVLVLQTVLSRIYSESQQEVLQTVAMVLSEFAASQNIIQMQDILRDKIQSPTSHSIRGERLVSGLARAEAVLHRPHIEITQLVTDDIAGEEEKFHRALHQMQNQVDEMIQNSGFANDSVHGEILEAYRMFAQDRGWVSNIIAAIHSGLTAQAAVKKVLEELHIKLERVKNPYVRQRFEDLEDISTRLLYHLAGKSHTAAHSDLPEEFILVAHSLGPAELLEYSHKNIKGLVLEKGSVASHITLMAKMMDIPAVAGIANVTDVIQKGDLLVVDGDNAEIYIRPSGYFRQEIEAHIALRKQRNAAYEKMRSVPPISKDGERISINLNIGLHLDADQLAASDVNGIGLYRTELPYLASNTLPTVEQQRRTYSSILEQSGGKPVIFRTFDIGGDKVVPYLQVSKEENPAMGWRGTRIGLEQPALLRQQLRALITAAIGYDLYIMFPMIATAQEFMRVKHLLELEESSLRKKGQLMPNSIKVGIMVEIPSIIDDLHNITQHLDFVSIGSNDLLQFYFAADRGSSHVAKSYDTLQPSVLRLIKRIVSICDDSGIDVSFCGDMATRPLEAMALLACGVRSISIPPRSIGAIKSMICSLDIAATREYIDCISSDSIKPIRNMLTAFARDHQVVI